MNYQIHFKEKKYFITSVIISLMIYGGLVVAAFFYPLWMLAGGGILVIYGGLFSIIASLMHIRFLGYLGGNAILVNQQQFPEIFEIVRNQSRRLELETPSTVYLLQGNGILNAFSVWYGRYHLVVLHTDIVAAAYRSGTSALEFIIGRELGRKKMKQSRRLTLFLLPSKLVIFLTFACMRARELTLDNIGYALCPEGAQKGLLILAAGADLAKKVNVSELLFNAERDKSFTMQFAEILSTRPHLVKRIAELEKLSGAIGLHGEFVNDKPAAREGDQQVL